MLRSAALHETRALLVEAGARDASAEIDPEELLAIASNRPPVFAALVDGDVARVHAIVDANPVILHVPYEGLYAGVPKKGGGGEGIGFVVSVRCC